MSNSHITLSFLFIWNWIDKYVHAFPDSLESRYRIQTKLEAYIRFLSKPAQNPYPLGRHIPIR